MHHKVGEGYTKYLKQCPLCLRWFYTKAKRRKFCCTYHTAIWNQFLVLERKIAEGKIPQNHWRYNLYLRLKHYIEKERALVESSTTTSPSSAAGSGAASSNHSEVISND